MLLNVLLCSCDKIQPLLLTVGKGDTQAPWCREEQNIVFVDEVQPRLQYILSTGVSRLGSTLLPRGYSGPGRTCCLSCKPQELEDLLSGIDACTTGRGLTCLGLGHYTTVSTVNFWMSWQ